MGRKTMNFFEYQDMLERDFKAFSAVKLLQLGTRIAELEFDKYADHFAARRFDKYGVMLKNALSVLQRSVQDRASVTGPEIDQAQKEAVYAGNKLWRKLDTGNEQDAGLLSIIDVISNTIHFLKTEDPLYLISVYSSPHLYRANEKEAGLPDYTQQIYYHLLATAFKDQIELLWQLKGRMKI
jgi:hypothetical protein